MIIYSITIRALRLATVANAVTAVIWIQAASKQAQHTAVVCSANRGELEYTRLIRGRHGPRRGLGTITMAQDTLAAFFSYSRDDSPFALRLAKDLKAAGAVVWLDRLDIRPGQHWDGAVEKALADCPNMLLILSPSSVASPNVMDEVSFALDEGKLIIPVLYKTCKIPFRIRRVQHIDARSEYDEALRQLVHLLAGDAASRAEREERKDEQERIEAWNDDSKRDVHPREAAEAMPLASEPAREMVEKEQQAWPIAEPALEERAFLKQTGGDPETEPQIAKKQIAKKTDTPGTAGVAPSIAKAEEQRPLVGKTNRNSRARYWIAAILALGLCAGILSVLATRSSDAAKIGSAGTSANAKSPSVGADTGAVSPEPEKSVTPPPQQAKEAAPDTTEWLKEYFRVSAGGSVSALRPFFEDTVSPYYGLPNADWAAIVEDKGNFFRRFPTIQYSLVGEPREQRPSEDRAVLEADMAFANVRQDGRSLKGTSHLLIELHLVEGQWKISGIRENVSK
jgi:hypothetical protein